ncbi:hypothetical protein [Micromonospora sp. NPDC050200]|uniref:hypothetical protein n=1 Tax=Micromonospora sp. NPDC050200 TaxID=3155664 RepID=UPI0033F8DA35
MIEEILASGHHWLLHSLALNRQLPNAVRMRLAAHTNPAIRAALAAGAHDASRELYERLIDDPNTQVREHLAERDDVPADLLARLPRDPDPKVRTTLARWWTQAPEAVRRVLWGSAIPSPSLAWLDVVPAIRLGHGRASCHCA